jgi:hypothetical protein
MMKLLLKRLNEEKIALRREEGKEDKRRPPPKPTQNDKNRAGTKGTELLRQKTKEGNRRRGKTDQRRSRCGN